MLKMESFPWSKPILNYRFVVLFNLSNDLATLSKVVRLENKFKRLFIYLFFQNASLNRPFNHFKRSFVPWMHNCHFWNFFLIFFDQKFDFIMIVKKIKTWPFSLMFQNWNFGWIYSKHSIWLYIFANCTIFIVNRGHFASTHTAIADVY